jgi:hypothetical protein
MSPRSLSWIVQPGNDMQKLLIVVCVAVYIFPNQKQLDSRVRSRKKNQGRRRAGMGVSWIPGQTIYGVGCR